jgi:hypothetical protein
MRKIESHKLCPACSWKQKLTSRRQDNFAPCSYVIIRNVAIIKGTGGEKINFLEYYRQQKHSVSSMALKPRGEGNGLKLTVVKRQKYMSHSGTWFVPWSLVWCI